ncbi:MAG: phospholipase effector Tle1 domain-containing protein [Fimbriimonadales bacterium]
MRKEQAKPADAAESKTEQPCCTEQPKNIVLCFDGTGDWAAKDTTNVMRIHQRLDKDSQLVYYSGGIGTLGSPLALSPTRRMFLKLLDLAVATSLRDHALDAYTFLVENHNPGDRIYLFGFSRGAFTARLLASLIHNFGLLESRNENLTPYLWQTISEFSSIGEFKSDAAKIKRDFARPEDIGIEFIGLFDTVSSVGVFERFKVFPYTDKNDSVKHLRHAVSIDEQRNCFPDMLLIPDGNDVGEVWFPGVHRDIGGGGSDHLGYPNETLNWMVGEANKHGLNIDCTPEPSGDAAVHIPFFDPYALVGLYPMKMFDYALTERTRSNLSYSRAVDRVLKRPQTKDSGFRWFWPNFKHIRRIPSNGFRFVGGGQVAHQGSVLSIGDAKCTNPPIHAPLRFNLPDLVGIVMGVALSFLVANRGMDSPFGESWPAHTSGCALALFALFLIQQGFSQWLAARPGLAWINRVVPVCGVLAAAGLAILTWKEGDPWWMLAYGAGLGLVVALVSLVGRKPILPGVRVIPLLIVPWLAIVAGLWVAPPLLYFLFPAFASITRWLFDWDPSLTLFPILDYVAWGLALLTGISGLAQIVQDRRKM